MIYGTKLLDTDTEIFIAALTQTPVYVWSLDSSRRLLSSKFRFNCKIYT